MDFLRRLSGRRSSSNQQTTNASSFVRKGSSMRLPADGHSAVFAELFLSESKRPEVGVPEPETGELAPIPFGLLPLPFLRDLGKLVTLGPQHMFGLAPSVAARLLQAADYEIKLVGQVDIGRVAWMVTRRPSQASAALPGSRLVLRCADAAQVRPLLSAQGKDAIMSLEPSPRCAANAELRVMMNHLGGLETLNYALAAQLKDKNVSMLAGLPHPLTSLDLGGCKGLTDRSLETLCRLEELRKVSLPFNVFGCSRDADALKRLSKVESLDLSYCQLSYEALQGVGQLSALTCLDLQGNDSITTRNLRYLGTALSLRSINLAGLVQVEDEGLELMLPLASSLQSLNLMGCKLSYKIGFILDRFTALTNLALSSEPASNDTIKSIARTVRGLKELSLTSSFALTGLGLREAVDAGLNDAGITALYLSGCSAIMDLNFLEGSLSKSLQVLDVSGCRRCLDANIDSGHPPAIALCKKLKKLRLSRIDNLDAARLTSGLRATGLRSLDLAHCPKLNLAQLKGISPWILEGLEDLNISGMEIKAEVDLPVTIPLFPCLTRLCAASLRGIHRLRPETQSRIAASLRQLASLDMSDNLSVANIGPLLSPLAPTLRELDLRQCPGLTVADVGAIGRLSRLTSLDISDCNKINGASLAPLGALLDLEFLNVSGTPGLAEAHLEPLGSLWGLRRCYMSKCDKTLSYVAKTRFLQDMGLEKV